ncbi:hypothetical protein GCM10027275_34820 [Rhabdobacter roseus]|uniref:Zinc-ribbon 15 domain-containing protein n=1 Tax=Rhabdobacter roseus TaxID=1655419 RepID=A0A840TUF1_9BACT|nr:hypothetical protein [Rhabdobacter roseus]MBB5285297.1 hypothetical protein [Rhabdobacter roseus]
MIGIKDADPEYLATSYDIDCKYCHSPRKLNFYYYYSYSYFGFLKVFPLGKSFYSQCQSCKHFLQEAAFDDQYRAELNNYRDRAKLPWTLYIGPVLIGYWLISSLISSLF